MAKSKKLDTQAIGLDVGLSFAKFLTGKENLHYGLWASNQDVCASNMGSAQEAYTQQLFSLLPKKKTLRILDIGGGAGETAKLLISMGHHVDIVIPSAFLAERCRVNAGDKATVHECKFEDFESSDRFDVCLFSESFQYIPLACSLEKAPALLAKDGVILVSDCFRSQAFGEKSDGAKVGGGHPINAFRRAVSERPLKIDFEEDITQAVAPSVEVEQALFNVIGHGIDRVNQGLGDSRPSLQWVIHQFIGLFLNKRRRYRLQQRFMEQTRSAENFCRYNVYLMMKISRT